MSGLFFRYCICRRKQSDWQVKKILRNSVFVVSELVGGSSKQRKKISDPLFIFFRRSLKIKNKLHFYSGSSLSNRRVGQNKRAGGKILRKH